MKLVTLISSTKIWW